MNKWISIPFLLAISLVLCCSNDECGTEPDTTPPAVISTTPLDGAFNVPVNTNIMAVFSEKIDPSSADTSTFRIGGITGTVSCRGDTLIFDPEYLLAHYVLYEAILTTGIKDLAGNSLATEYKWTFDTGSLTP